MGDYQHVVTRLPGAPQRRAGLAWPLGETLATELSAAQVAALEADPNYRVVQADLVFAGEVVPTAQPRVRRPRAKP